MPDPVEEDQDGEEEVEPKSPQATPKKKKASSKAKEKGKAAVKGKGKGKGKGGGTQIPDEWPWEEAKKIFEKPDVLPADEVEVGVSHFYREMCADELPSWNGTIPMSMAWSNSLLPKRGSSELSFLLLP